MDNIVRLPKTIISTLDKLKEEGLTRIEILSHESMQKFMKDYEELILRGLLDGYTMEMNYYDTDELRVWRNDYERASGEVVERYQVKLKSLDNIIISVRRKTEKKSFEKLHKFLQEQ
ncbi:hypothetical protein [Bacillus weihaiensis]|uniref:hypothetical protein n=1 Tax=Bacillus weihaiensis TaxID=1547283 RepID=UPI002354D5EE|nr:hypothetical protein [Bacillus weihaiensis]